LQEHAREQPELHDVAAAIHMSPYHFQRLFARWAGMSPKQFLRCLTLDNAKRALCNSSDLLDASYEAGLSGPGRLHDLFVTLEGITPGEYKQRGVSVEVKWGAHTGLFGDFVIATTERGICGIEFFENGDPAEALQPIRANLPSAKFSRSNSATAEVAKRIFSPRHEPGEAPLHLWLKGTNFQVNVWRALLRIEPGQLSTYGDIAHAIGRPRAARAVGTAIGANPVAFLIPCHRVIRATSLFDTNYRWGPARKLAMIGREITLAAAHEEEGGRAA
jgi:AraC family transcriptional regulator of adaptative response/methylated-DNA-[protein]-cysteine methyltransferase